MRRVTAALAAVTAFAFAVPGSASASAGPAPASVRARAAEVTVPPASVGEWWFDTWRVGDVWAAGARGQGITVALVDSGVDASRPQLTGRVLPGTDFAGGDGRTPERGATDREAAHGTNMALLVAGQGGKGGLTGVAPEAMILPVGRHGLDRDFIRWAADHGARVINMSVASNAHCTQDVVAAVRYAVDRGAVLVAGAGNDGDLGERLPESPASCPGVLAVGAVDAGRHVGAFSSPGTWVDVASPGMAVPWLDGDGKLGLAQGTSQASALTSAAVAVVWSKHPQLTNRQVVARILATVRDDADRPGRDDRTGAGVVRLYQSVMDDIPADAPNPVFDELDRVLPPSPAPGASSPAARPGASSAAPGRSSPPGSPAVALPAGPASGSGAGGPATSTVPVLLAGGAAVGIVAFLLVVLLVRRRRDDH